MDAIVIIIATRRPRDLFPILPILFHWLLFYFQACLEELQTNVVIKAIARI